MKCPNCGFNSFDYLEVCKKCKLPLNPSPEYKSLYKKARKNRNAGTSQSKRANTASNDTPDEREIRVNVSQDFESYEMAAATPEEHNVPVYKKAKEPRPVETDDIPKAPAPAQNEIPKEEDDISALSADPLLYSESLDTQDATNQGNAEAIPEETESYSIAALKLRFGAFILDLIVIGFISYIAIEAGFYFMGEGEAESIEVQRIFLPIYILLFFLASTYFIFLHYYSGTTLGKMVFGIKIISSDGGDIGLWESFMRWVGYYISAAFLFAGFIWSIFDRDSQAWHDKIAGTYVVKG